MTQPKAARPRIPSIYGVPTDSDGLLPWAHVTQRMTESAHYWLSTVDANGGPHTRCIDGMWLDNRLYFGGSPESKWCKNLAAQPQVCVNLENAEEATILHGTVKELRCDQELAERLAAASNEKYNFGQTAKDYLENAIFAFSPEVAFAWKVLYKDATRWRLEE